MEGKEKQEIGLCILVPGETFDVNFVQSFADTLGILISKGVSVAFRFASSAVLPHLRNNLISGGDERQFTYGIPFYTMPYKPKKILFLDSDILFSAENVLKLFDSEEDIISGWYLRKEGFPVAMKHQKNGEYQKLYMPYTLEELEGTDLMEIGTNGMGFVCVTYEVLEKIGYPWFKFEENPSNDGGFTFPPLSGEDIWFFNRAREEGFKVMLDPTIHVGHLKTVPLGVNREQNK